jgi:hypothetical protein
VIHIVRGWGIRAAAIALIVTACSSGDRQKTDTGAAATGATASANQAAPSAARLAQGSPLPGALSKPIEQYTGDELYAFVHGLTFTGGVERQRHCREAGCAGPQAAKSVQVRVDAVDTQDSLSAQAIPQNGVVAARATSRGPGVELMYGMQPGAGFEYYLVVLPAGQSATWRLVELTTSGTRSHRTLATGTFTECHHDFVRGARADFKTCAQAATVRPAAFGKLPQTDSDPPIWISCATGCCTADSGGHG